jgi:HPt (histidine-containing phosphotransfer) domain-containing protein
MNKDLKIVDYNHLNSIASGDENFKKELILIFLKQIPDFINNMKKYLGQNKFQNLAREAHTAKSSVLIFGMENTGRLLKEIEQLAENSQPDNIQRILLQVETELNQANSELQEILKGV